MCDLNDRMVGRILFISDRGIQVQAGQSYGKETHDEVVGVWWTLLTDDLRREFVFGPLHPMCMSRLSDL